MDNPAPPTLPEQLAAALEWWRDAGVDSVFGDAPLALLDAEAKPANTVQPDTVRRAAAPSPAPAAPAAEAEAAAVVAQIGGDRANWPQDWASFADWWRAEPSLAALATGPILAPRGPAGADLLVLVPQPEAGDTETLLTGPAGQLVSNMLRAMGVAPERACVAAALPGHTQLPDWHGLSAAGLGAVLVHLLTLAAPARLLVLGQDVLPLLGQEKRQGVRDLPLAESRLPMLASLAPEILLTDVRSRADLWRRWLDWTGTA